MRRPPIRHFFWKRAWRVIPTRYPEEQIYAPLAARGDWPAIVAIERLTNEGVHQEHGDSRFLRETDRIPKGKSAYNIGRPFAFPTPSRFSDGRFGIFYAAHALRTAAVERAFHAERFLRYTDEAPAMIQQRVLVAAIRGRFHDIRIPPNAWRAIHRPDDYSAGQRLGGRLWEEGAEGLTYRSVRDPGGECVAVFRPQAVSHCRQDRCLQFEWTGKAIRRIVEIREFLAE